MKSIFFSFLREGFIFKHNMEYSLRRTGAVNWFQWTSLEVSGGGALISLIRGEGLTARNRNKRTPNVLWIRTAADQKRHFVSVLVSVCVCLRVCVF